MELLDCGVFHTGRKADLENLFWVKTPNLKHRLNLGVISPRKEFYHYSSFSQKNFIENNPRETASCTNLTSVTSQKQ